MLAWFYYNGLRRVFCSILTFLLGVFLSLHLQYQPASTMPSWYSEDALYAIEARICNVAYKKNATVVLTLDAIQVTAMLLQQKKSDAIPNHYRLVFENKRYRYVERQLENTSMLPGKALLTLSNTALRKYGEKTYAIVTERTKQYGGTRHRLNSAGVSDVQEKNSAIHMQKEHELSVVCDNLTPIYGDTQGQPQYAVGGILQGVVQIRRIQGVQNPHTFNSVQYYNNQGIMYSVSPKEYINPLLYRYHDSIFSTTSAWHAQYEAIALQLAQGMPHIRDIHAILHALLFGNRYFFTQELESIFITAGIMHTVVLSGLHLSCLGVFAWCIVRGIAKLWPSIFLHVSRQTLLLCITLSIGLWYANISLYPIAFMRALVMLVVYCIVQIWGYRITLFDVVFMTICIFCVIDPTSLYNTSLQISVLCVLAIYYALPFLAYYNAGINRMHIPRFVKRIAWSVGTFFCITLAIQVLLLPYQLHTFGTYTSPLSVLINCMWLPVLSIVVLPAALLSVLLYLLGAIAIVPYVAYVAVYPIGVLIDCLYFISEHALLSGKVPMIPHVSTTIAYIATGILLYCVLNVKHRKKCVWLLCIAVCCTLYPMALRIASIYNTDLTVTVLDVGSGQAVLLESQGKRVLIDTGVAVRNFDAGARIISPYLRYNHTGALDAIILSHFDSDHVGGTEYLAQQHTVCSILHNGDIAKQTKTTTMLKAIFAKYRPLSEYYTTDFHAKESERDKTKNNISAARHILYPLSYCGVEGVLRRGDVLYMTDAVTIHVLDTNVLRARTANAKSLVLLVRYKGNNVALIPGDIDKKGQEYLVQHEKIGKVPLIIAPHHGSKHNFYSKLYTEYQPETVFVSNGRRNVTMLTATMEAFFAKHSIKLYSTYKHGALTFHYNTGAIRVTTWEK